MKSSLTLESGLYRSVKAIAGISAVLEHLQTWWIGQTGGAEDWTVGKFSRKGNERDGHYIRGRESAKGQIDLPECWESRLLLLNSHCLAMAKDDLGVKIELPEDIKSALNAFPIPTKKTTPTVPETVPATVPV